jgi:citrate lyase subunit beta/citryl-CoA lyase
MPLPNLHGNHSSLVSHEARACLPGCISSLRRSWLFVPGLDRVVQRRGLASGADVLVADLEELTAPNDRRAACIRVVDFMAECRQAGAVGAVRINALAHGGRGELEKIIEGGPDAVLISQAEAAHHIEELAALLDTCETRLRLPLGRTAIVPVLATPLAIVRTFEVLGTSPRVKAAVLAGARLAAALGMEDTKDAAALRHVRSRFALECAAARCLAVDSAHALPDAETLANDLAWTRGMGFKSKCAASADQVDALNKALSPLTGESA